MGSVSVALAVAHATTAIFAHASYPQGALARVDVDAPAGPLVVQPIPAAAGAPGTEATLVAADPAAAQARTVRWKGGVGPLYVHIGDWPSGVYFLRLRSQAETVYAPVVVRPARLGLVHVAVVVPTYTWQAYNFRDGDTWYACRCVHTVDLERPYLRQGVPPNFTRYDRGFLEWLASRHEQADVLSDQDLERFRNGAQLHRLYRLVIFEGHHEYVTAHEYDVTSQYRDAGGHLMFLSANSFFRDVAVRGNAMTLIGRWRDLGRPEAALLGAEYLDWNHGRYPNRPYRVVGAHRLPWLFAGSGLRNGSVIAGAYGIEIDAVCAASPPNTIVLAQIPDIFGRETAQMTYYRTARGAEVFDAGTMNFGGSAELAGPSTLLTRLWEHMA